MKKTLRNNVIGLFMVLFSSTLLHAQAFAISTTETEYNYLVNGYEDDLKNGKEVKSGYSLDLLQEMETKNFKFKFFNFIKIEDSTSRAVYFRIEKKGKSKTRNLCIPFNNNDLLAKFIASYNGLGIQMQIESDVAIFSILQQLMNSKLNKLDK